MSARDTNSGEVRAGSKRIGALAGLWGFVWPYRAMVALACVALVITAAISLILPIAVRRVVDGFETSAGELLDQYFIAALAIAGALALGTGLRYYLVTRLGERVVADIRKAVFDRMIGMSPVFYEKIMTGEVLSRITTDTTLILSVIGSSVSIALRNVLIFIGGLVLMLFTSAKLTGLVLLIVPAVIVPIIVLGATPAGAEPRKSGLDCGILGQCVRSPCCLSRPCRPLPTKQPAASRSADVTEKSFDVCIASDHHAGWHDGHRYLL